MLLEFKCSNYKSINEEVTFSMTATSDNTYEDKLISFDKYQLLRNAAIYGGNGSGKSNFIKALVSMACNVRDSHNEKPNDLIKQDFHKINNTSVPTTFSIQFIRNGKRYAYGYSITNGKFTSEYLYTFPNGKQVNIFERKDDHIKTGQNYKNDCENVINFLKPNRLFLSCCANYTKNKELEDVYLFFKEDIVFYNYSNNNWIHYSANHLLDKENKEEFLKVLKHLLPGVIDFDVSIDKFDGVDVNGNTAKYERPKFTLKYRDFTTDLESEESDGTKRLFEFICPFLDIIKSNKILLCDEFEKSLHATIITNLIKLFYSVNNSTSQLIFTTHDTRLLSENLFRRDQIWFTELKEDHSTELYSLSEINNVRKTENLEKGYLSGKYGGVPLLDEAFSKMFINDLMIIGKEDE